VSGPGTSSSVFDLPDPSGRSKTEAKFDPFEPGFLESPYEQYARLRAHDPVHWSELLEGWVVTRYDDVAALLRDPTTGTSVELDNANPTRLVVSERDRMREANREAHTLVLRDDPDHHRLRKLLQRPFGPRQIEGLRRMVHERVEAALAEVAPRGAMDVIDDFAYPLPVGVFCEMFGLPDEDSPKVRDWIGAVARGLDPVLGADERDRTQQLIDELYEYLDAQIDLKRAHPADDVMTQLVQPDTDGDVLSRDELVAQIVTVYVAGHEPTTSLIGTGLLALLRQPGQLARLRAEPGLLPNAVHELLRYDGPNQFVRRIALRDITLGARTVAAGDVLYVCVGAANRDPARWGDPDVVRIDRPDAAHHLQFGAGIHTCLGSHLARLQAEIALGALVTGLDGLTLAAEPEWSDRMVLRGLRSLAVAFTARS
jgi:cytochrome P450